MSDGASVQLMAWAQELEAQVSQLEACNASAGNSAMRRAELRAGTEAALQSWQAELQAQISLVARRLEAHVATQREAAAAFEADLERNIDALQQMQRDVRRRAESLDSACNVCVERLSGVAEHAVALRRAQFVHSELDERCVQNV